MAVFETDKQKNGECANMQDAATLVSKNILLDRENVDLSSQLNVTSLYSSVSSGLNEDDYPAVDTIPIPLVSDIRRVPLPPELVEQFGRI
uniref:Uncharacterized protein n=1 Tax=Ciona savignyi TaxID=51511 RepID=H2ZNW4_CIOSA